MAKKKGEKKKRKLLYVSHMLRVRTEEKRRIKRKRKDACVHLRETMIATTAHNVNQKEKTLSKTEVLDYAPQCTVTVLLFSLILSFSCNQSCQSSRVLDVLR